VEILLVSACREKNFALALKTALSHFSHNYLSATDRSHCTLSTGYNCLATSACSTVTSTTPAHSIRRTSNAHIKVVMAEPETKTAIMLDQAEVDAAEATHAAQENGGEDGEYIGRRPSSSGRDSKRYRKCYCCLLAPTLAVIACPSMA
jgi:hypothetical protein